MSLQKEQARAYLKEALLTLESAKAIFKNSSDKKPLWSQVVKNCYDAMEQAISAAIRLKERPYQKTILRKLQSLSSFMEENIALFTLCLLGLGKEQKPNMLILLKERYLYPIKFLIKKCQACTSRCRENHQQN
jgi:hypothetical protein